MNGRAVNGRKEYIQKLYYTADEGIGWRIQGIGRNFIRQGQIKLR